MRPEQGSEGKTFKSEPEVPPYNPPGRLATANPTFESAEQPMDLMQLVSQPTWREFLVELVSTQQMDPWDIDVGQLSDAYLSKVRQLQSLDLRVPANIILASAILLYFKAQTLRLEEQQSYNSTVEETPAMYQQNLPELVYRPNRPRTRRVTLDELLQALDRVIKQGPRKLVNAAAPKSLIIELPPETLEERMERVLRFYHDLKDTENVVLFSSLVERVMKEPRAPKTGAVQGQVVEHPDGTVGFVQNQQTWNQADAVVYCLAPILHLCQNDQLQVWQESEFGEIFLQVTMTEKATLVHDPLKARVT